jgi:hypothetical protein
VTPPCETDLPGSVVETTTMAMRSRCRRRSVGIPITWYLEGVPIEAVDYDWPAADATVDTVSLLQLIPQIRLGVAPATMNPYE